MSASIRVNGAGFDPFQLTLERWENQLDDSEPVFQAMAEQFGKTMTSQFRKQGGHSGSQWAPLSPAYAAWKQRLFPGKPILQLGGDLRDSLIKRPFGVDEVWDKGMVVGTAVPYATYHQNGTDRMPARPIIGKPTQQEMKTFGDTLHSWVVKGEVGV